MNRPSSSYDAIMCWFCNKKCNTQFDIRSRIKQNKPLTWKKEVKSKFSLILEAWKTLENGQKYENRS
jgi:hypothetical protein